MIKIVKHYERFIHVFTFVVGIIVMFLLGYLLCTFVDKQKAIRCSSNLKVCWFIFADIAAELDISYPIIDENILSEVVEKAELRIHEYELECPCKGKYWFDPNDGSVKCTYHHGELIGVMTWPISRVFVSPIHQENTDDSIP